MTDLINGTPRMLHDRMLIRPLPWKPSEVLDVVRYGRPVRGEIVAIGPGEYPKKYKRDANGQKKSFEYSRHFRATELKLGQIVEIGGINIFNGDGYKFDEVIVGNETLLMCCEKDVAVVCE